MLNFGLSHHDGNRSTAARPSAFLLPSVAERESKLKLPHPESAEIPEGKLVGYLLSPSHRSGKSKAAFFSKHGFSGENWQLLAAALRRHATENLLSRVDETAYGARYVVDGPLAAPDGSRLNVRTVWFINHGTAVPRFATAHPLKRKIE